MQRVNVSCILHGTLKKNNGRFTRAILQNKPNQIFRYNNLVEPCNMGMQKLPMMVNLPCKVRVIFVGRLEHNLAYPSAFCSSQKKKSRIELTFEPFVSLC